MPNWNKFKAEVKKSEGNISHMYLDSVGKVTVGVGNMLPDVAAAQRLPFIVRANQKPASPEQIASDFDTVSKKAPSLIAVTYKKYTKLDLRYADIEKLLDQRIKEFTSQLKKRFPDFGTYPIYAQFAVTDMAFNLGIHGLVTKFPKFTKAVKDKNWTEAAKQSKRPQLSVDRNKVVRVWLEEAAKQASQDATNPAAPEAVNLNRPQALGNRLSRDK
ncbi:MAG: hypothetical protein ACFB2Z_11415 [Maricaulaceae bacterium]